MLLNVCMFLLGAFTMSFALAVYYIRSMNNQIEDVGYIARNLSERIIEEHDELIKLRTLQESKKEEETA